MPGTFVDEDGHVHLFSSSFSCNDFDPHAQELWLLDMRVQRVETALEKHIANQRSDDVQRMIDLTATEIADDGNGNG